MERTQRFNNQHSNTRGLKRYCSDGDVHIKKKQDKPGLVIAHSDILRHTIPFLNKEEIGSLKKVNKALFNNLQIEHLIGNPNDIILPEKNLYHTSQIGKEKQNQNDRLDILFRMHSIEEISDTILRLCTNPLLPEHAPTYFAQLFVHLLKHPHGTSFFVKHYNPQGILISLVNFRNNDSITLEFLAQAFSHLIDCEYRFVESFFLKNNNTELRKAFIHLVNHPNHNPDGRQFLAQVFNRSLTDYNEGITQGEEIRSEFIQNDKAKDLRQAFIHLVNHPNHNPTGRQFLAEVLFECIADMPGGFIDYNDKYVLNAFIVLTNQTNHNSKGLEYLAEAFCELIRFDSFFLKKEGTELIKTFIHLVNQPNHNSHSRNFLAHAFLNLMSTFEGRTLFFKKEDTELRDTFMLVMNHPDYDSVEDFEDRTAW